MADLEIEFSLGHIRAIPVVNPAASAVVLAGPGELFGWSFRESGAEVPLEVEGSVLAPGAGATIALLFNVPVGTYNVSWQVELAGAAAAADASNFLLKVGAVSTVVSINPGAAGLYVQSPLQITVSALSNVSVTAIGAGTAGVTYTAQFSLSPAPTGQAALELRDGNSVLAEITSQTAGMLSHWLGPQGVRFFNQIQVVPVNGLMTGAVYARYARAHGYT